MTPGPWTKLDPGFYLRDTVAVARDLLGRYLVRDTPQGRMACRITETEAYCGEADKACHSYRRGSKSGGRTNVMYEDGGLAYVYLIYGMYCCLNVVTRPKGHPEAVLLRSAQPMLGLERMAQNRRMEGAVREKALLTGPGKLCQAMAVDRELYGEPLWGEKLWLAHGVPPAPEKIAATPRVNIAYAQEAADFPWRFVEKDSPFLSIRYKPEQEVRP